MKENEEKVKYLTQLEMKKVFKVIEKDNSIHSLRNLAIFKHHFHTLKHTAAVHLAESEIDIKKLQYYLGHKSVTNTPYILSIYYKAAGNNVC